MIDFGRVSYLKRDIQQLRRRLISCQIRSHGSTPQRQNTRKYHTRFNYTKGKAELIHNGHVRNHLPMSLTPGVSPFETPKSARTATTKQLLLPSGRLNSKHRHTN